MKIGVRYLDGDGEALLVDYVTEGDDGEHGRRLEDDLRKVEGEVGGANNDGDLRGKGGGEQEEL